MRGLAISPVITLCRVDCEVPAILATSVSDRFRSFNSLESLVFKLSLSINALSAKNLLRENAFMLYSLMRKCIGENVMGSEIHVSVMVSQLVEASVPVSEIAKSVGVAQSTITRIQGKKVDPRYSHFAAIRDLWQERLGSQSAK